MRGKKRIIEVEINCPEDADIRTSQAQVEAFLAAPGGTPLKAGYFEMSLYASQHEVYELIPQRFQVEEELLPVSAWRSQVRDVSR